MRDFIKRPAMAKLYPGILPNLMAVLALPIMATLAAAGGRLTG